MNDRGIAVAEVNGGLALLGRSRDDLLAVLAPEIADGRIAHCVSWPIPTS